jgi:thiol-disulfide isomerase/thioredoxin
MCSRSRIVAGATATVAVCASFMSGARAFEVTSIDEFTDAIALSDEPAMVLFGTPTCGHCRAAKPHWASFEREFWTEKRLVRVADVNCVASKDICDWHGVTSYPTIKYFDGENGEFGGEYKRAVTYDALAAFAEHYLIDDDDDA